MSLYLSSLTSFAGTGFDVTLSFTGALLRSEGQAEAEGGSSGGACKAPLFEGYDVDGYEVDGTTLGTAGEVHAGRIDSSCGCATGAASPVVAPLLP